VCERERGERQRERENKIAIVDLSEGTLRERKKE
jgi:hypothetical protein